jgi:K+-transporting ATPase ATPase B chain
VPGESLVKGDVFVVRANEVIAADGEIIEGAAVINEAAVTGEAAPVVRQAGGDRSGVTGGTTVLSDEIKVRVTTERGESFLDRMIRLVEGAKRQKTPNELALCILLSALTLVFTFVVLTMKVFGLFLNVDFSISVLIALLVCVAPTTIGGLLSAIGIAAQERSSPPQRRGPSPARSKRR